MRYSVWASLASPRRCLLSFSKRVRRVAGGTFLGIGALGVSGAALLSAMHPAAAASALAAIQSAVTCSVTGTNSCVSGTNTSSGIGVYGTSNSGTGVRGNANSNYGMKGTSGSSYGIYGSSTSGRAGVVGTTASHYGVYGYTSSSTGGYGVVGSSVNGYGVYGSTTTGSGIGVIGYESGSGTGVEALTSNGYGLYSNAYGSGSAGYFSAGSGYGLIAYSAGNPSVYARNSSGNGGDFGGSYIGLIGRAPASGGYPLIATDSAGNNLFYVDGAGNLSYKGGLFTFARTVGGGSSTAFSAKMTSPTVEDTGSAQLIAGAAVVRLNPTFAASIDPTTVYRVFITPDGDTKGLFVAQKTAAGFIVRESQSGRSTVNFDYRIVAMAVGQANAHMTITRAGASLTEPRGTLPIAPRLAPTTPITPAAALGSQ